MIGLMRHAADVYRPTRTQRTAQEVTGYTRVYRAVPCFAQPASAATITAYAQRGQEVSHTVYTTAADKTFQTADILEITDPQGRTHQLHVVGVKDALMSGLYQELACSEYPEGAKRRLDREDVA